MTAQKKSKDKDLKFLKKESDLKCEQQQFQDLILQNAVTQYQEALGLRFEKESAAIKFIFHCIEKCNPEKEFGFTLSVKDSVYEVKECDPHVGDLPTLVQELNRTNNLQKFVILLRKRFKSSAMFLK